MILSGIIASIGLMLLSTAIGVYLLILGLGMLGGLCAVVNAVTWPRYYGRLHLGAITGKIMSLLVIASAIAPSLFSYCYTIFGSYSYMSYMTLTFLAFLVLASFRVKNPQ